MGDKKLLNWLIFVVTGFMIVRYYNGIQRHFDKIWFNGVHRPSIFQRFFNYNLRKLSWKINYIRAIGLVLGKELI
jgi:hypothetical protein